jgi:hypothetical protein
MPFRPRPRVRRSAGVAVLALVLTPASPAAQIGTDLVEKNKAEFHKQATDADMKRDGGTQPRDWDYHLPAGVTTRQITFHVDGGTPLYGKIDGKDVPRRAITPSPANQAQMVRLARAGQAPPTAMAAAAMNEQEARLSFAEYHPFWYVD